MTSQFAFLLGENIYLRPLCIEDSEGPYISWFNDEEVCRGNQHHTYPYTLDDAKEFILTSHDKKHEKLILAIILKNENIHIGNISLHNINPIVKSAELSLIIGDKSYWGKGIGKEACKLICDHAFNSLNISRISCGTFEPNIGMIKIAQYLGMKKEGCRRNAAFKNGKYIDVIEFGVLKEEYKLHGINQRGIENE